MRLFLLLLVIPLALGACGKSRTIRTPPPGLWTGANTLAAGSVITTPGVYGTSDARESTKLELIPAGKDVHWSFRVERQLPSGGLNKSSAGGAIQLNSPADPWFVFAESPTRLWFFNGSDTLAYTVKDEHVSSGGQAISGGNLQNGAPRIPTEVIRKLPAPLQQLFPPVPPAGPKPSI